MNDFLAEKNYLTLRALLAHCAISVADDCTSSKGIFIVNECKVTAS